MSDTEDQGNGTADQSNSSEMAKQELNVLKARAKMMGITHSNNISLEALRKKVKEKMESDGNSGQGNDGGDGEGDDDDDANQDPNSTADTSTTGEGTAAAAPTEKTVSTPVTLKATGLTAEEADMLAQLQAKAAGRVNPLATDNGKVDAPIRKKTLRQHMRDEEMKLVRVRIANLDPKKKDLPGEILTVANEYLGTVRKFVPYGEATDDGFHIPMCLYRMLEARKFQNIRTVKNKRTGTTRVESSWQREFSLEVLPQLTQEEITRLALAQQAAGSVE